MQLCLSDWKNVFVFLWNIFLCQAVSIWRNVDETEFVFCRFGYFLQLGESWHKIAGGHFGSRFRLCCDTFSISHPFVLGPTLLEPRGQAYLLYFCSHYSSLFPMTSSMKRTAEKAFEDPVPPTSMPVLELKLHVALSPIQFQMLLDPRPLFRAIWVEDWPTQGNWTSSLFHELERSLCRTSSTYTDQKFMLCTVSFSYRRPYIATSTDIGTWRWSKCFQARILSLHWPNVWSVVRWAPRYSQVVL